MKKIEARANICLLLALVLLLGLGLYIARFVRDGGRWVAYAANRHLYNSQGSLAVGRVLDRDGDVLSWVEDGVRRYYNGSTVRKATLHAVGDPGGNIGTGALTAFANKLSGYNQITGAYHFMGAGNDLYLTLDARYNYIAYEALGGRKGAVGVYNYKTGELLCMVSSPSFDPLDPPAADQLEDPRYEGVYLNRFLSGTFVPGSVFKTITLTAALECIPDVTTRHWTCTGSTQVGGAPVTCPKVHGELDLTGALAHSCNGVFALLAAELGRETLTRYVDRSGLTSTYQVSGIRTAPSRISLENATGHELGWAGVGQHTDLVNPCALMVYMGAVANGGRAAVPQLVLKTVTPIGKAGLRLSPYLTRKTGELIQNDTAQRLSGIMAQAAVEAYGTNRFPNMDLCAKSGTAEVGGGLTPNAWFTGFLRNPDAPYAFVVLVEQGGGGAEVAGTVAARVLDAIVNGY
ncbi:MAG: penicillin-binding protein [Oscillospiraceae bacterium]|nr:penicillin-binding protein [Oscillospiraceae bacterium]